MKTTICNETNPTDASNKSMDVSGKGELTVQEELGLPHNIKVVSGTVSLENVFGSKEVPAPDNTSEWERNPIL